MLPRTKNISIHISISDFAIPITSILFSEIFDTFCFSETLTNAFKAMTNTNFTGEIAQIFSSREEILITPEVECTAKNCFYNANNRCEARNIMIVENRENEMKNQCETFLDNH